MDMNVYERLGTLQEKAKYLLQQEITLTLDMVGDMPVARACVGCVPLPIVRSGGESFEQVAERAKAWLQEIAENLGVAVEITGWKEVMLRPELWIRVPALAVVNIDSVIACGKPSVMDVERLAAALVAQAQELIECGPDEWRSVDDMLEGAINNIRFDMKDGR